MYNIKNIVSGFLILILIIAISGCAPTKKEINSVKSYLENKYNAEFEYVSSGSSSWSSVGLHMIFKDSKENRFNVYLDNVILDNYMSVIFDTKASTIFQGIYDFDYKVYVSTGNYQNGKNDTFKSDGIDEYLKSVSYIQVIIYTDCQTFDTSTIAPLFLDRIKDKEYIVSFMLKVVIKDKYDSINGSFDDDSMVYGEQLAQGSFWVNADNTISSESWDKWEDPTK